MTDIHEPERKLCLVCGRVLDYHQGTGTYEHGFGSLQEGAGDHPAIAVSVEEAPEQLRPLCDFCYADNPEWILPASAFKTAHFPSMMSADWGGCTPCIQLIERNEWNGLFRRAKAGHIARNGPMLPEVETALKRLYRDLRKNVTGAPYRETKDR